MIPHIGDQEEVGVVLLSNERQDFAPGGVFWQGLNKIQRGLGAPFFAEDFWKVSLRHGLSPHFAGDGWFQSSSLMR